MKMLGWRDKVVVKVGKVRTVFSSQLRGATLERAKVVGGGNIGCICDHQDRDVEMLDNVCYQKKCR